MYAEANRQGRSTRVYTPARVLVVFLWQNALSPHGGARAASAYNTLNRVSSNIKCNQTRNGHRQDGTCNSIAAHSKQMGIFHGGSTGGRRPGDVGFVCLRDKERGRGRETARKRSIRFLTITNIELHAQNSQTNITNSIYAVLKCTVALNLISLSLHLALSLSLAIMFEFVYLNVCGCASRVICGFEHQRRTWKRRSHL